MSFQNFYRRIDFGRVIKYLIFTDGIFSKLKSDTFNYEVSKCLCAHQAHTRMKYFIC